ncbi:MAG: hypothetical protein EOM91_14900 [Sphingobacteriia bacterium]|nr:hypothetical protein [Sphingobacteriia bacterium]NCC38484.1 hypothetical protein [Gammaproteobacteria bacterium]
MRLIITGAVAVGMSAASQVRRRNPDSEIIVLEKTQDVSNGACGLPDTLPLDERMEDLQVMSAERNLDLRLGHEVTRIGLSKALG